MLIPESRNCNHLFTLPFCLLSVTTTITTKTQSNKQKSCTQTVLFDCIIRFFFQLFHAMTIVFNTNLPKIE